MLSIPLTGLPRNKNPFKWLVFLFLLKVSMVRSFFQFLRIRPAAVIATGGFVSYPYLFWARVFRKPLFICEQNSYPGLVNRLFAPKAKAVFTSMNDKSGRLKGNLILTGNPVMPPVLMSQKEAAEVLGIPENRLSRKFLGVVGGSQGAAGLNRWILEAQKELEEAGFETLLSVGQKNYPSVMAQKTTESLHVFDFIKNMGAFYSLSDRLVCRAGASTLSELFFVQKPVIFVPYPFASDNHQEDNARFGKNYLPSEIILEKDLAKTSLIDALKKLDSSEKKEGAKEFLSAAEVIVKEVLKWI